MALVADIRKNLTDTTPVFAAVGLTDVLRGGRRDVVTVTLPAVCILLTRASTLGA